jgi:hypothetical protein
MMKWGRCGTRARSQIILRHQPLEAHFEKKAPLSPCADVSFEVYISVPEAFIIMAGARKSSF